MPEDRCHLNGVALRGGRPQYPTAVSRSDVTDGWLDRRGSSGVVADIESGKVVCEGLSIPRSPRWHRGSLWLARDSAFAAAVAASFLGAGAAHAVELFGVAMGTGVFVARGVGGVDFGSGSSVSGAGTTPIPRAISGPLRSPLTPPEV